ALLSPSPLHSPPPYHHLHSFPTRRSSDLPPSRMARCWLSPPATSTSLSPSIGTSRSSRISPRLILPSSFSEPYRIACERFSPSRSEEHTSELQSLRHLVCRLLLEKKKIDS